MPSCEFYEIFKSTFCYRKPEVASVFWKNMANMATVHLLQKIDWFSLLK